MFFNALTKKIGKNQKLIIFYILIILVGVFLRFYRFTDRISFYGDQARDLLLVYKLFELKEWIYHGPAVSTVQALLSPLFYYTLAIPYKLSNFNILTPFIFTGLINSSAILAMIYVTSKMFGKKAAIFSGILYATSFLVIKESIKGTNPGFIPPFSILLIYSLYKLIRNQTRFLNLSAISFISLLNFNAAGIFTIFPFAIMLFFYKVKLKIKNIIIPALILFLFVVIPYGILEWKFRGYNLGVMLELIRGKGNFNLMRNISNLSFALKTTISDLYFPGMDYIGIFIALFILLSIPYYVIFKRTERKSATYVLSLFIFLYLLVYLLLTELKTAGSLDYLLATVFIPLVIMYTSSLLSNYFIGLKKFLIIFIILLSIFLNLKKYHAYADTKTTFKISEMHKITNLIREDSTENPFNIKVFRFNEERPDALRPIYSILWSTEKNKDLKYRYFERLNWGEQKNESLIYIIHHDTNNDIINEALLRIKEEHVINSHKQLYEDSGTNIIKVFNKDNEK